MNPNETPDARFFRGMILFALLLAAVCAVIGTMEEATRAINH